MSIRVINKATKNRLEKELMDGLGIKSLLKLTLSKAPYDIMVTGEKQNEFRKPTRWILSRLLKDGKRREYDLVQFSHGYAKGCPFFICEFKGFFFAESDHNVKYGPFIVEVKKGDVVIKLGQIIKVKETEINGLKNESIHKSRRY